MDEQIELSHLLNMSQSQRQGLQSLIVAQKAELDVAQQEGSHDALMAHHAKYKAEHARMQVLLSATLAQLADYIARAQKELEQLRQAAGDAGSLARAAHDAHNQIEEEAVRAELARRRAGVK